MRWIEVRQPGTGKLLFRFDPWRDLIEIQQRNVKTTIDLSLYRQRAVEVTERESAGREHA